MSTEKIEKAIVKFLVQEANTEDLDLLSVWIEKPENLLLFEEFVAVHYKTTLAMAEPIPEEMKEKLLQKIRSDKTQEKKYNLKKRLIRYAAAAIVTGVIAAGYLIAESNSNNIKPDVKNLKTVNNNIKAGTNKATLTLENGNRITFAKGSTIQTKNASSNGEQIIYKPALNLAKLSYNILTTPRGGQFFVKLSDGTKVWLNSQTQLKYPVSFIEGKSRKVELVYGEAYFDVSHSTLHNGSGFVVENKDQNVKVLGTEFNIKAYKDESSVFTTLVKGKIALENADHNQILKPGQQAAFNSLNNTLQLMSVDVYDQISWKEGIFSFKRTKLKDIMKTLSRWYDMEVVFENKKVMEKSFNGDLGKDQKIEEILESLKSIGIIKNYEINDKKVILK